MSDPLEDSVTSILRDAGIDDPAKADRLLPIVYDDLRRLARKKLAGFANPSQVEPTAVANEAWVRLLEGNFEHYPDRRAFFLAAARVMKNILIDRARRRATQKLGGDKKKLDLENLDVVAGENLDLVNAVHDALGTLDPHERTIVELRFFAGLDMDETSIALGIPLRTLERDWTYIRTRLYRELSR